MLQKNIQDHVDDTDVFGLLFYLYQNENLQSSLTMQSPIQGASCIDVNESAGKHAQ